VIGDHTDGILTSALDAVVGKADEVMINPSYSITSKSAGLWVASDNGIGGKYWLAILYHTANQTAKLGSAGPLAVRDRFINSPEPQPCSTLAGR
jgi:hypothetical protein